MRPVGPGGYHRMLFTHRLSQHGTKHNRAAEETVDETVAGKQNELVMLCARHGVRRLALFGSAVTGGVDPERSDLDFVVEFETMPPKEHADAYFGLLEDLEQLFEGVRIDLIEYGPIRNPYFRRELDQTQVVLYEAA